MFLIALLVWLWRTPRRDVQRASVLGWGLWLLAAAAVLSFMNGIFHAYYTVILGPPVAALVGIGAVVCWDRRVESWAQATMAGAGAVTAATGYAVLQNFPNYHPWLPWVLLAAVVALLVWLVRVDAPWTRRPGVHGVVLATALALALAGPLAYAVTTVTHPMSGAIPSAGPPTIRDRRPDGHRRVQAGRDRCAAHRAGRVQPLEGGHAGCRRGRPSRGGRRSVHLGRRDSGLQLCGGLPTGNREVGDAARRFQRF